MPFHCADYAGWLRDLPAGAHPAAELARLLALGMLEARVDSLLLPVLVGARDDAVRLDAVLEARGIELGWHLAAGFFGERLESGACLLLLEEDTQAGAAAARWPRCRVFTVAEAAALLQSSVTCPSS